MDPVAVAPAVQQNDALLNVQKPGGWEPIKNINDPYVQELGRFAVMEHTHNLCGASYEFIRVVSGESQVVGGKKYCLVIEVKETIIIPSMPSSIKFFKAIMLDKAWEKSWALLSFVPCEPIN
ncbi:cysteine proteinase inhibitor 6-like [Momordica charantia]|uniref:Cysteine proteinase inhibitor 6-like n=1 Tax=Momordica charantia TaxID=3673 RepID=A0A6J1BU61_MOMCH|nr:cysteine proteinase inhibitor 6-like [Momordica charantia]